MYMYVLIIGSCVICWLALTLLISRLWCFSCSVKDRKDAGSYMRWWLQAFRYTGCECCETAMCRGAPCHNDPSMSTPLSTTLNHWSVLTGFLLRSFLANLTNQGLPHWDQRTPCAEGSLLPAKLLPADARIWFKQHANVLWNIVDS